MPETPTPGFPRRPPSSIQSFLLSKDAHPIRPIEWNSVTTQFAYWGFRPPHLFTFCKYKTLNALPKCSFPGLGKGYVACSCPVRQITRCMHGTTPHILYGTTPHILYGTTSHILYGTTPYILYGTTSYIL